MSAGIMVRDIQTGIEMAWHKLTRIVAEINKVNCGIIYPMEMRPLYLVNEKGETAETPYKAVVSLDDMLPIGGTVGEGYKLVSNEAMVDMVQNALGGTKHRIVSIGTINNREKVFCSISLDAPIVAAGRKTETTLNVLWGHGGKFGILARSGFTVVVCANTFAMAMAKKGEFELRVRHTGNAQDKLDNMAQAIDSHYGVVSEFNRAMNDLAAVPCSPARAKAITAGFVVRDFEKLEGKLPTRTENIIERIGALHVNGRGNDGNDMADYFNAVTDYYSHESSGGENRWKQYESSEFGMGQTRKREAFDLLMGRDVPKLGDLATVEKRGERVLQFQ
jgi:hypothetical protein